MIQEPSNPKARFQLYLVARLTTDTSSDTRFAREHAQQAIRTLAMEHDFKIAKKAATIMLSQDAIDNLPLSKALALNDEILFKDLLNGIAKNTFKNKVLLRYFNVSESSRNVPGNVSVQMNFSDFPEMRAEVFNVLVNVSKKLEELGMANSDIKARTFGFDLDFKNFVSRVGNFDDAWVFESQNDIISFANDETQDLMLANLLTTKDNPSSASMKFYVEQNPNLDVVFNAWMAKQKKPSIKMDGLSI